MHATPENSKPAQVPSPSMPNLLPEILPEILPNSLPKNLKDTFQKIISNSHLHALWLNSLSYLEYRGFRKIVKSHGTHEMTLDVLSHTAEEVRHALFFKKLAVKEGGSHFSTYLANNMLLAEACKRYFFEIDQSVRSRLPQIRNAQTHAGMYLLVTRLIEVRAVQVYIEYEKALRASGAKFTLEALLREEDMHLAELGEEARALFAEHSIDTSIFSEIEEREFRTLWSKIEEFVDHTNSADETCHQTIMSETSFRNSQTSMNSEARA